MKKTGITASQADDIMTALNFLRGHSDLRIDVSTRTALMIGDMMAVGASLRQALAVSLQTSQEALESVLIGLHVNKGYTETVSNEYVLFDQRWMLQNCVNQ